MIRCFVTDSSPLGDPQVYCKAYALLPDARRGKADFYRFPGDRCLSVTAGLFIRLVENTYGEVAIDANGKPHCPGAEFNISHSGHYVAFAISERPVGIDIEAVGRNMDIARRVMDPDEYRDFIDLVDGKGRDDVFARMWTAKESYMKALGLGFRLPPESFRVLYGYDIRSPDGSMTIRELDAPEGFRMSVCSDDWHISLRTITAERLMAAGSVDDIL